MTNGCPHLPCVEPGVDEASSVCHNPAVLVTEVRSDALLADLTCDLARGGGTRLTAAALHARGQTAILKWDGELVCVALGIFQSRLLEYGKRSTEQILQSYTNPR